MIQAGCAKTLTIDSVELWSRHRFPERKLLFFNSMRKVPKKAKETNMVVEKGLLS